MTPEAPSFWDGLGENPKIRGSGDGGGPQGEGCLAVVGAASPERRSQADARKEPGAQGAAGSVQPAGRALGGPRAPDRGGSVPPALA